MTTQCPHIRESPVGFFPSLPPVVRVRCVSCGATRDIKAHYETRGDALVLVAHLDGAISFVVTDLHVESMLL
jgi:hypothetical protein